MAVTITTRFGITRWSHKDDVFSRQQMDDSHAAIEQYGAIFRQSDFSARPPAGMAGRFHYASDTLLLTYDDGVAWRDVLGPNTVTLTGTQTLTNKTLTAPVITGTIALPATTSIGNVSATEIGYVDGVTSAIQTQLNAKAPTSSPSFTGSVVLPSTTNIGTVSATELGFLDGVTSAIQTQINAKANTSHTHSIADVLTLQTALDAKGAVASGLNQFAATTSAQLAGVITDETGTGVLVYGTEPTLTLPYINNVRRGYTTTATSGGSTALTVNSNYQQFFTGSSIHDVQLPDVTTLTLGHTFCITNNGSATLTIKTFGSNVLLSLPGNTSTYVTCVAVTGTNTASWSAHVVGTGTITGTGASVLAVSPTLTGTPLAPTAPADTNNTQIASTAYVMGQAGAATPIMAGVAAVGTSLKFARQDHVHPADTTKVSGPSGSSTDTAIALYDGTGARLLKNSVVTIDASGNVAGLGYVNSGIWQGTAISATYIDAAIARVSALNAVSAVADAALPKAGGTMTGNLNMGGQYVLNIGQSGASNDAATVGQVNAAQSTANAALSARPQRGYVTSAAGGYLDVVFSPAFSAPPVVVVTPLSSRIDLSSSYPFIAYGELTATGVRIRGLGLSVGCSWVAYPAS
jgi:hypothetical protein